MKLGVNVTQYLTEEKSLDNFLPGPELWIMPYESHRLRQHFGLNSLEFIRIIRLLPLFEKFVINLLDQMKSSRPLDMRLAHVGFPLSIALIALSHWKFPNSVVGC